MAYCTVQQVKDHLGISEADDDDLLTTLIDAAQSIIDTSYGHRQFRIVDPAGLETGFFSYLDD